VETDGSADSITVWPEEGKTKSDAGEAVKPEGRPEIETVTVSLKPPVCDSVKLIDIIEFGEIEIWLGVAEMEKDGEGGGGEDVLEVPPPQP